VPELFNHLYLWGVYCCVLLFFPTIFSFYCWVYLFLWYKPWIKHVPHLHNEMYIVILFWFATFWLIVVLKYNINQWVIIIYAPTFDCISYDIIRYERRPRAPAFTSWHQRHKLRANNKERSYDDKHAWECYWFGSIIISW
jgi:hypothetical protein